jgi:hypothetical protein
MEAHRREIKERMKIMNANHNETLACQETKEERQEEKKPTSPDRKPEAAQKTDVPAENATVMPVGEPKKKRRRDRKLAAERRRQEPKETKKINGGPQEILAVARSGSSRRGKVTLHTKEIDRKITRRTTVTRGKRDTVRTNLSQGAGGFPRKRLIMTDKTITRCVSMAEHKRLRPQGDQLESTQKCVEKDTRKRELRETVRRLRKQFEACANAQAGVLRENATNKNIKNWTLWRARPPLKRKKGNSQYGRNRW